MSFKSYKIALNYLSAKSLEESKNILLNMLDEIKNKVIGNKKDFLDVLKKRGLTDKDVIDVIQKQIESGKDFMDYVIYLGENEEGIGYIPQTWFVRNIADDDVIKYVPLKDWPLIRKPNWIEKNKRY